MQNMPQSVATFLYGGVEKFWHHKRKEKDTKNEKKNARRRRQ